METTVFMWIMVQASKWSLLVILLAFSTTKNGQVYATQMENLAQAGRMEVEEDKIDCIEGTAVIEEEEEEKMKS